MFLHTNSWCDFVQMQMESLNMEALDCLCAAEAIK